MQIKQENPEEKAILHIPTSVRGDSGKYTITAKNEFGEDSGDFKVIVLGRSKSSFSVGHSSSDNYNLMNI